MSKNIEEKSKCPEEEIPFKPSTETTEPEIFNPIEPSVDEIPVKEDDMIIFPAALDHEIAPQGPTKEPRITISSNIKINKI